MKQNLGIIIILVGVIVLILHAVMGGNTTLFAGLAIEIVGLFVQIFTNKQRKY